MFENVAVVSATDKVGIPPRGSEVAGCVKAEEPEADMFACTTWPSNSINWSIERSPTIETAAVVVGRLMEEREGHPRPRVPVG